MFLIIRTNYRQVLHVSDLNLPSLTIHVFNMENTLMTTI